MNENGMQGPTFGIGGFFTLSERLLTAVGIAMMANVFLPVSVLSAEKENVAAATQLKNGSFETIVNYGKGKRKEWDIKDGKGPLNWSLLTKTGSLEVCTYPDGKSHYVKLSGGAIYQFYQGKEAAFQIRFKLSGKGTVTVRMLRQKPLPGNKRTGLPTRQLKKIEVDSAEWQEYTLSWKRETADELVAPIFVATDGTVSLDDVMIVPEQQ